MKCKTNSVKWSLLTGLLFLYTIGSYAQTSRYRPVDLNDSVYQISGKKLIIPSLLAGYGFAQFMIDPIPDLNLKVRQEFNNRVTKPFHIDDYSQFAPAAAVYGLNLIGVKGKHNFFNRSVILATSMVVMQASVEGMKYLTHIQRPDGSSFNAFPSGHTATAFACAEFLFQEYKDVSAWYGIAGYTIAAGTGIMRMYNNRHWLTDVVAGAGFGILSTKIAYWMFPQIRKLLPGNMRVSFAVIPSFDLRNGQAQ